MPDLSNQASQKFWFDYPDSMIYRVITFMESVEDWTIDGDPQLEDAIKKLGETLDDVGNIDLKEEDDFIALAAHVKAARLLRILQCLDTAHPGAASKLLMYAETKSETQDDVPGLFLRRNVIFERLRLLSRIFAPSRIDLITKVLEESDHD